MSMVFKQSFEELKALVEDFCAIEYVKEIQNGHQIVCGNGTKINWYPTTGKVNIQGKQDCQQSFVDYWESLNQYSGSQKLKIVNQLKSVPKKVFVVHGHDDVSRDQLELIIHKLGLEPFVLANTSGGGLTIIEALENEINASQSSFGIVLMTPDDIGYSKKDGEKEAQARARQNVVLEMGMLISALGRNRVAILVKGHVELPSDANGILYMHFNDHVKEITPKLIDRLTKSGFNIASELITKATS